jgi:hypothetical protein
MGPIAAGITGAVAESVHAHSVNVIAIVLLSLTVAVTAIAVWPIRMLDVTPEVLRFRERGLPSGPRYGRRRGSPPGPRYGWRHRTTRLRSLAWHDVAEVLVTSDHGQVVLVVGFKDQYAGGLAAAMVELPADDERAVADAVRRAAPGAVVRQDGIAEILIRTREPYVLRRWGIRTQLLAMAFGGIGAVGGYVLLSAGELQAFRVAQMWLWSAIIDIWLEQRQLVITPEWISVGTWWRRHTVPWATVGDTRLMATGDGGELTVTIGERTVTYRLPQVSDLGALDTIIRAYAPPQALSRAPG